MESWYRDRLQHGESIILSESGFTNNEITLKYLNHFIKATGAGRFNYYFIVIFVDGITASGTYSG